MYHSSSSPFSFPGTPPSTPPRTRPPSRHNATGSDWHPYSYPSSSSSHPNTSPPRRRHPHHVNHPPAIVHGTQHFSRLLNSVLGSPFLTTSDHDRLPTPELDLIDGSPTAVPHAYTVTRPSSPAPTADFSIINMDDLEGHTPDVFTNQNFPYAYRSPYHHARSTSGSPASMIGFTIRRHANSHPGPSISAPFLGATGPATPPNPHPIRSLIPRLWDALASPGRTALTHSTSPNRASSPRAPFSPSTTRLTLYGQGSIGKGKGKTLTSSPTESSVFIDYSELPPLDGEEGELIDDEACFIDVRAVTGIDIISLLPPELSLYILSMLCTPECLPSVLSCLQVSHIWRRLASDNAVWRAMFLNRWSVDMRKACQIVPADQVIEEEPPTPYTIPDATRFSRIGNTEMGLSMYQTQGSVIDISARMKQLPPLPSPRPYLPSIYSTKSYLPPLPSYPVLDWRVIYRERMELDKRWAGVARAAPAPYIHHSPSSPPPSPTSGIWEPRLMRISGHNDSVYCLQFDSNYIITGSRDRTIKVWSLHTGRLLGNFTGVHRGSVLCLKFEANWEENDGNEDDEEEEEGSEGGRDGKSESRKSNLMKGGVRKGFMVSGSSDCSVCVWDLFTVPLDVGDEEDGMGGASGMGGRRDRKAVCAEARAVLTGHVSGVLDLRIDKKWIVSCSKDAVIRVWNRDTLEPHRTLRGHEGPVNAIGLQSGRVVSASGDGKMILWDIVTGERIRTLEGHDRGLACIEFKGDTIISGSNDCKIKVWSASTGECVRTLVGHDMLVRALAFDPKSGRLVSTSYDRSIKVWDINTGKLIREFKGLHTSHIFDVKFDVARVVSTSHDHKIVVLDFSHGLNNAALFV